MKKFITLCAATTMVLSLATAAVWAEETTVPTTGIKANVKSTTVTQSVKEEKVPVKPNKDEQIRKANEQLQKFENIIQAAIQKEKRKRDSKLEKLENKEERMKEALTDADKRDLNEKAKLDEEIAKWTEYQKRMEAGVNEKIAKVDADIAKAIAIIDAKILAATDDATKQKLTAEKVVLQSSADVKKKALQSYLTALKGIWADRQKVWDMRKDLLIRRQAADAELRTALQGLVQTNVDNAKVTSSLTDAQIESNVRARHQKAIDSFKAKILRFQGTVTVPTVPSSTDVTKVPVQDGTTVVPPTTTVPTTTIQ